MEIQNNMAHHLVELVHPTVMAALITADQAKAGIWFQKNIQWWDEYVARFWISNRWWPPIIVATSLTTLVFTCLLAWFSYDLFWCLIYQFSGGNSKWSTCPGAPVPVEGEAAA